MAEQQFYIGPGRVVQGSLHEPVTVDQNGKPRDKPQIFFAVAVPKGEQCNAIAWQIMNATARDGYRNERGIMPEVERGLGAVNFSWKLEDGDSEKNKGREGFAGCWVYKFATSIIPIKTANNRNEPISPTEIKCGDYVDVMASCAINGLKDKNAGLFMNPRAVRLLGYGTEIQQGQSAAQMFAAVPAILPPGASALPVAAGLPPTGVAAPASPAPAPVAPPAVAAPASPAPVAPPPVAAPAPAAPPPPAQTKESIEAESAAIAAAAGQQHYPGYRLRADRSGYDPDPTPAPAAPAPAVPAGAAPVSAPATAPNGSTIASPINPPPGVSPHPGFLNPKTPDEVSAEIAAAHNVQHYSGYRFNPATRAYDPNPAA